MGISTAQIEVTGKFVSFASGLFFCKDFLSTFLQKQFADLFVIEASFSSSQSGIFSTFIQQTFFSQHLIAARPTNQTFRKLVVFVLYRHLSTSCCYKPGLFKISGLLRITTIRQHCCQLYNAKKMFTVFKAIKVIVNLLANKWNPCSTFSLNLSQSEARPAQNNLKTFSACDCHTGPI